MHGASIGAPRIMKLSVVVPAYNEAAVLPEFLKQLFAVLASFSSKTEVIVVDDGSSDDIDEALRLITPPTNVSLRCVRLSRNIGHMLAIKVGLEHAHGDVIATMDADLQDPPELLVPMIDRLLGDHLDVVQAERIARRKDTVFKRTTARGFYAVMQRLSGISDLRNVADYRVMTADVKRQLLQLQERRPVFRLLIPSMGFSIGYVGYERPERKAGESKYSVAKMVALAIDTATSFSTKPLRIMSMFGGLLSLGFAVISVATLLAWAFGTTIPGWTSLAFAILSANAAVLAALGLVGEYVGKIFEQVQQRPLPKVTVVQIYPRDFTSD